MKKKTKKKSELPKLRDCPFCGPPKDNTELHEFSFIMKKYYYKHNDDKSGFEEWKIECGRCGATGSAYCESKLEAILAWNTRRV